MALASNQCRVEGLAAKATQLTAYKWVALRFLDKFMALFTYVKFIRGNLKPAINDFFSLADITQAFFLERFFLSYVYKSRLHKADILLCGKISLALALMRLGICRE